MFFVVVRIEVLGVAHDAHLFNLNSNCTHYMCRHGNIFSLSRTGQRSYNGIIHEYLLGLSLLILRYADFKTVTLP